MTAAEEEDAVITGHGPRAHVIFASSFLQMSKMCDLTHLTKQKLAICLINCLHHCNDVRTFLTTLTHVNTD